MVVTRITDDQGGPIPCKVQFIGSDGTASPDFGPDSGEHAVKNVYYSHDGRFRRELEPGSYDVIVSYGPEYDAVFTRVDASAGKEALVEAKLVRSVKTEGWISTDFHSHSSPSGDNTSSQLGRVLNLLCEQVEFAPCTEHNRLSTYDPHLKRLGAERRMATCVGIELTGRPLAAESPERVPARDDGPTPRTTGPRRPTTIPRSRSNGSPCGTAPARSSCRSTTPTSAGCSATATATASPTPASRACTGRWTSSRSIRPTRSSTRRRSSSAGRARNNTIVNWLQLLNQGQRIPGVVNTDAHYNFHGSGWLRNYVKSPTDDPAEIQTLDVVHAAERGNLVMSSGPFLEVKLVPGWRLADGGDPRR